MAQGADLVQSAFQSPFLAGAVVGSHDEDRVVEPTDLGEEIDQPAGLHVGAVEEAGDGRLKLDGELLLLGAEAVPRFDPLGCGAAAPCPTG